MAALETKERPGLSLIKNEHWYVGAISEKKSEEVLSKQGDAGCFLVRDSLLPDADYVLSVNSGSEIWHYNIKVEPDNECILNTYRFTSLPDAITFHSENRLGSVFLKMPKEPVIPVAQISKTVSPLIKVVTDKAAVQPRAVPLQQVKQEASSYSHDTAESSSSSKVSDSAAWQENNGGSQSSYSPALRHSPTPQHFVFNSDSHSGSLRSQGSAKSQTSEVDCSYILPSNEIESVYIEPSEDDNLASGTDQDNDKKDANETEFCETRFDSSIPTTQLKESPDHVVGPGTINNQQSDNNCTGEVTDIATIKGNMSGKQNGPPPVVDTKLAPEKQGRGLNDVTRQVRPKSPIPPVVPKRVSSMPSMPKTDPPSQDVEAEPAAKTSSIRTPKRITIPELFQEKKEDKEEVRSPTKLKDAPVSPRWPVVIPQTLEERPLPPPMSTHPGLAAKAKELEENQQEESKPQAQMGKKRSSFIKIKKRNSKKEKRKSIPEEPILLENTSFVTLSSTVSQDPPKDQVHTKRHSGVPTPALSPGVDEKDGELESKFKFITKQEWNSDLSEEKSTSASESNKQSTVLPASSSLGTSSPSSFTSETQKTSKTGLEKVNDQEQVAGVSTFTAPKMERTSSTPAATTANNGEVAVEEPSLPQTSTSTSLENKKTHLVNGDKQTEGQEEDDFAISPPPPPYPQNGVVVSEQPDINMSEERTSKAPSLPVGDSPTPPSHDDLVPSSGGVNTGVSSSNGHDVMARGRSLTDVVPGVQHANSASQVSQGGSSKQQMPPGFMIVGPAQPLPPLSTNQRRLTMPSRRERESTDRQRSVSSSSGSGPMNTKRGQLKKKKSLLFKSKT